MASRSTVLGTSSGSGGGGGGSAVGGLGVPDWGVNAEHELQQASTTMRSITAQLIVPGRCSNSLRDECGLRERCGRGDRWGGAN
jgi:hypothetical protein